MNFLLRNIFLIIFFCAAFFYGYANCIENELFIFVTKFFLVPSFLIHYLVSSKAKNSHYIIALILASSGDLLFSGDIDLNMIALCCFILYNLFLINISFEKIGFFSFSKVILNVIPFFAIFLSIFLYLFRNNINYEIYLVILYFITLSLLASFNFHYYLKTKSIVSLYFLIGTLLLFISNLAKGSEYFKTAEYVIKIINISTYALSHYFYYKAIVTEIKK